MPKKSNHPRFRTHVRKGANGQRWVSYWYDMRPDGKSDVPLGTDYATALTKWAELHERKPRIAGTILEGMEAWEREKLDDPATRYENAETRKSYRRQLARIKAVFGGGRWDEVGMPELKGYLKKRTAKTQGNRELAVLSIVWHYAQIEGFTKLPWPAAGLEKSRWKNPEPPRQFAVTDALFDALWTSADPMLRDAMDIATSTGLRLTDVRTILLPTNGVLSVKASKTRKSATFEVAASPTLSRLVASRALVNAPHLMLLSSPTGRPVTARMLRDRWDEAREKAAQAHPELADELRAMYLRDMRKRAADLAGSLSEASSLLQHSSEAVTATHYRTKPTKLRPVR